MENNLHISCSHCFATNRVRRERLGDSPKCGKCKLPLFEARPVEINSANVQFILNNTDVPVLVDCWAPWCGPCRSFAPVFECAAGELEPGFRLAKLNTEREAAIRESDLYHYEWWAVPALRETNRCEWIN